MKISVTFCPEDIICGMKVGYLHKTELWMVGFDPWNDRKALISLDDGMIAYFFNSKEDVAEYFNKTGAFPLEILNMLKEKK